MRLRYDFAAIVALSSAAAVLTALSDYALSLEKSLDAVSLRMVAAFFITAPRSGGSTPVGQRLDNRRTRGARPA